MKYYVATNGSDSNSGSVQAPFLTIGMSMSVVVPGDVVYVRQGTYAEWGLNPVSDGTVNAPISITNYPGEIATIDGGNALNNCPFDLRTQYFVIEGLNIVGGFPAGIRIGYNGGGSNITVNRCDISGWHGDDNTAGIYIEWEAHPDGTVITNNKIHDHQSVNPGHSCGIIIFQAKGLTIGNNRIYNSGGAGIYYKHSFDDPSLSLVENNHIHDNSIGIQWSRRLGVLRNNVLVNNTNFGIRMFVEAASCDLLMCDNNQIIKNTIVGSENPINLNREGGYGCPGAIETLLRDNLVYDFNSPDYQGLGVFVYDVTGMQFPPDGHTRADHNLIYSPGNSTPVKIANQL